VSFEKNQKSFPELHTNQELEDFRFLEDTHHLEEELEREALKQLLFERAYLNCIRV